MLGAKRTLRARTAKLAGDCTYAVAVAGAARPARLRATVGFGGNERLLPRLIGPRLVPRAAAGRAAR